MIVTNHEVEESINATHTYAIGSRTHYVSYEVSCERHTSIANSRIEVRSSAEISVPILNCAVWVTSWCILGGSNAARSALFVVILDRDPPVIIICKYNRSSVTTLYNSGQCQPYHYFIPTASVSEEAR
jgi:hypothetical protein